MIKSLVVAARLMKTRRRASSRASYTNKASGLARRFW